MAPADIAGLSWRVAEPTAEDRAFAAELEAFAASVTVMSVTRHHDGWLILVNRGNAADDQYLWITDEERRLLPGLLREPRRLKFRDFHRTGRRPG